MKDYKRLTKKYPYYESAFYEMDCTNCMFKLIQCKKDIHCFKASLQRLGELEDKIKQGRLIELPCPIGAAVYEIRYPYPFSNGLCCECKHDHSWGVDWCCDLEYEQHLTLEDVISTDKKICPNFKLEIVTKRFTLSFYEEKERYFNLAWFLTKEEAEAKLQELKGEQK